MHRLKDFPPNLLDLIVVASTASADIGLITRSKTPLSSGLPAENISNVFTTTTMADDARRAQMPMTEELADTSPIGLGFDLSSKDKVLRPLPKEEFDTSQGPLPALMVLNNEGVLSSWWIVYAESIRQGTTYPGLVVAGGPHQQQQQQQTERQASPFASANVQATPAFGQSTYGKPSTPAGNFGSTFGKPTGPAFGTGSNFGSTSTLGNAQTPFGAPTTSATTSQGGGSSFGQPSFGSSAPLGTVTGGPGGGAIPRSTAFGMAGGMVNRPSVWGTPASGTATASGSIFGQSGFSGKDTSPFAAGSAATPFGSNAAGNTAAPVSGGFASFAAKPSGFMTAPPSSAPSSGAENPFAKSTPGGSFGSGMDTDTSFGAIPNKDGEAPTSVFGGSGFILGSTFKGDGTAADDGPKPDVNAYNVLFGIDTVGEAQKDAATPQSNDADMDEEANTTPVESAQIAPIEKEKEKEKETTTPVAKPASPQFQFPSVPPSTGGLFGTQSQAKTTPAAVQGSQPAGFPVGKPTPITTPPKETPQGLDRLVRRSTETSPKVKNEPHSDDDGISPLNEGEAVIPEGYFTPTTPLVPKANTREPPLPPESTSKSSFAPGDSSNSSKSSIDEAGLPSDFLPSKSKLKEVEVVPEEHAALPEDDDVEEGGLDDEGSGVDVAQEISPSTDPASSPKITPGSSFGGPQDKSPVGGLFTTIQDGQKSRPLFGEVGKTSVPYLPPPSKVKESPRSPSPVRSAITRGLLRPENGRSISAPDPFKALTNRKNILSQSVVPAKPQASLEEIRRQEREILAAQKAKEAAEEEQDLSDREDERVREEMNTEVEGTKILDPFLAHQDYIGIVDKPGIPGQIEKVYRDINSMIDTLGLNARSLTAFVKGHSELHKAGGRSRNDLEDDDDWCLKEIEELGMIEKGLEDQLKDGRIQDVKGRLDECREFRKGISSLRSKGADIARAIDTRSDPQVMESTRSAPLPLDQATQQHEIRKQLMKFQKLMSDAEENITVLRAKLASCESSNVNGKALKKPTVEAVTKTIMKMTSLVEKKSGDVDVLENQMRHLRFSSVNSRSSREGSPFASLPSTSPRRKPAAQVTSSILRNGDPPALGRSPNGTGTARKGSQDLTEAEVQRYREKAQRRQQVNQTIKEAFSKTGPRIRDLE